jgi:PncC family amidohydrolase
MPSNDPCLAPELVAEAQQLGEALKTKKLRIVTAESCTAGLLAATLSQVAGASEFLEGAFVTYTKDQKALAVGVPQDLLQTKGSVTEDVAVALAEGAIQRSRPTSGSGSRAYSGLNRTRTATPSASSILHGPFVGCHRASSEETTANDTMTGSGGRSFATHAPLSWRVATPEGSQVAAAGGRLSRASGAVSAQCSRISVNSSSGSFSIPI